MVFISLTSSYTRHVQATIFTLGVARVRPIGDHSKNPKSNTAMRERQGVHPFESDTPIPWGLQESLQETI
jgi:hypothetical protein